MERLAILSDTHGDRRALESVLAAIDAAGISRVWNLGDFASGGPEPAACVDMCRERCEANLLGNHEVFVLMRVWERADTRWARAAQYADQALGPERLEWLRGLRPHAICGKPRVEIVHANLLDPINGFLRSAADAYMSLQRATAPLVLFGHTHRATAYTASPAGLPDRLPIALSEPIRLTDTPAVLNPGAVCDKVGARWLELTYNEDQWAATWHRTTVRGHGGPWEPPTPAQPQ